MANSVERREERSEPPPPPPPPQREKVEMQSGGYRGRRDPPVRRYQDEQPQRQESLQTGGPRDR